MAFGTVKVDSITTSTKTVTVDNVVDKSGTQTFSAVQTFNAGLSVDGPYRQTAEAVGALAIDLSTGNYFTSVKFPLDTAPTLTAGKTHLFIFVTDDGGTRYRGAALVDYVN